MTATADPLCLLCVAWISRLGHHIETDVAAIAADRSITVREARALLLAAYHRHHLEKEEPWTD